MPCTTLLVGKNVSYDGSNLIARNEDCFVGDYTPKRMTYFKPEDTPRNYKAVLNNFKITLPPDPMGYTATPHADQSEGN